MQYAIIQLVGKQFKVSVGDEITTDKLEIEPEKTLSINDVLFVGDDQNADALQIGTPTVAKATVTLKALNQHRGEKIRVLKYKSKSRYRKVQGHKQHLTTLSVTDIKLA